MTSNLQTRIGWCLLILVLVGYPLRAEVGTFEIESNGPYIEAIIEDPDPVGRTAWRRHSPVGSGRIVLNEQGEANGDGYPSAIYNTFTRTSIVAWAKNSPGGFDVVLSVFADGQWTIPIALADSPADELDPFLTINPLDGSVHMVYWVDDGFPRVMHRTAPADLSSWSEPVPVSQPAEIALRPAAVVHDGALRVVYEEHSGALGGTPRQIVVATEGQSGFASQVVAITNHPGENRPEVHSRIGRLWVEWIDSEGEMSWIRELPGGGWDSPEYELFSNVEERDYFVRGRIKARALE